MPADLSPFSPDRALDFIIRVRRARPLVHCLTNDVVQALTANVLLAVGASPAMVVAAEEAAHFAAAADSLLVNVGTVHRQSAESMFLAADAALRHGRPWVLDPVAVGISPYRAGVVDKLLDSRPGVIRGNAAEILFLAGQSSSARGADSLESSLDALNAARALARNRQCVVAVTGERDFVTNGSTTFVLNGGHPNLTLVTGVGCSLSAMVAAFATCPGDLTEAVAAACLMMKKAGEKAAAHAGLGSFASALLDYLSFAGDEDEKNP